MRPEPGAQAAAAGLRTSQADREREIELLKAAFVRAIRAGQLLADTDSAAVQAAIAKYDKLGPLVTTAMALSGYPTGPVSKERLQRVAAAMLQFGLLGQQDAAEVEQGTLIASMIGPA